MIPIKNVRSIIMYRVFMIKWNKVEVSRAD